MIPLEKLIEYKGNRYEITKAMIELARNGKDLLQAEVKYKKTKYIPVVISNVLEGKIKFDYTDEKMTVDEYVPYKSSDDVYDETIYHTSEESETVDIDEIEEEDYQDDYEENEDEDI